MRHGCVERPHDLRVSVGGVRVLLLLVDSLQSWLSQRHLVLKLAFEPNYFHLHLFIFLFQHLNTLVFLQGLLQYFFQ